MVDFMLRQYVALQNFVVDRDEEGQGLAEYALILALIAIVAIVALTFLGGKINSILSDDRHGRSSAAASQRAVRRPVPSGTGRFSCLAGHADR